MLSSTTNLPMWAQGPLIAIVNPRAGSGRAAKKWNATQAAAAAFGLRIETWHTQSPLHATALSQKALSVNASAVFVIGGDGTMNEVVNGLMGLKASSLPVTILVPVGTGSDFSRTLYPKCPALADPRRFWSHVLAWPEEFIDIGHLTLHGPGDTFQRYFANVADVGLGGLTARIVNRRTKFLGGRMSFVAGALEAYATFHSQPLVLTVNGTTSQISPLAVIMANGGYFGGGMWIAPPARFDDGLLTLVLVDNVPRSFFLRHFIEVYQGRHTQLKGVSVMTSAEVEITAPALMPLDMDGEDLQVDHIVCRVVPAVLPVLRPRALLPDASRPAPGLKPGRGI